MSYDQNAVFPFYDFHFMEKCYFCSQYIKERLYEQKN